MMQHNFRIFASLNDKLFSHELKILNYGNIEILIRAQTLYILRYSVHIITHALNNLGRLSLQMILISKKD